MLFSEMGTSYMVREGYEIQLPEGENLLIEVPVEYGSSAAKFDHPNIVASRRSILNFKHYSRSRGKWWTAKPGLSYLFIIPKNKIELDAEKSGMSYVWVNINGQPYCLSVSGGGGSDGWTDYVHQGSSTFVYRSAKHLKAIAEVAILSPDVPLNLPVMSEEDQKYYIRLCAFYDARKKIKKGDKVFLDSWFNFEGSKGPFSVIDRPNRKRYFRCASKDWGYIKIKYSQIDWEKTARENDYLKVG